MRANAVDEGRTTRNPVRTRQALIKAGMHLFARRGYEGSSLEQIARLAGVNKALISYHFGGKRGLQNAIHDTTFQPLGAQLAELPGTSTTAGEDLRQLILAFAEMAETNPDYPAMLLRELIGGKPDPEGGLAMRILELKRILTMILLKGSRSGLFRPADPLLTQMSILGNLLFYYATTGSRERMATAGKLTTRPPTAAEFVDHLQQLVLVGLAVGEHRQAGQT